MGLAPNTGRRVLLDDLMSIFFFFLKDLNKCSLQSPELNPFENTAQPEIHIRCWADMSVGARAKQKDQPARRLDIDAGLL